MRWQALVRGYAGGGLALLIGCTTPAAPVPTAAPTQVVAPTVAAAPAQVTGGPVTVNGTLNTISGRTLSISTNTGEVVVQLAEDSRIEGEGKGSLADLQPGLSVAITGQPDGSNVTAVSIRIFPAALGTPRP